MKPPAAEIRRLQTLAELRFELRQFLQYSEQAALKAGLQAQQHQLILQVAGAPDDVQATVAYIAARLGLKHHSAVELTNRCEEAGLIFRRKNEADRRCVELHLTPGAYVVLRELSDAHARELRELLPLLIRSLVVMRLTDPKPANERRRDES